MLRLSTRGTAAVVATASVAYLSCSSAGGLPHAPLTGTTKAIDEIVKGMGYTVPAPPRAGFGPGTVIVVNADGSLGTTICDPEMMIDLSSLIPKPVPDGEFTQAQRDGFKLGANYLTLVKGTAEGASVTDVQVKTENARLLVLSMTALSEHIPTEGCRGAINREVQAGHKVKVVSESFLANVTYHVSSSKTLSADAQAKIATTLGAEVGGSHTAATSIKIVGRDIVWGIKLTDVPPPPRPCEAANPCQIAMIIEGTCRCVVCETALTPSGQQPIPMGGTRPLSCDNMAGGKISVSASGEFMSGVPDNDCNPASSSWTAKLVLVDELVAEQVDPWIGETPFANATNGGWVGFDIKSSKTVTRIPSTGRVSVALANIDGSTRCGHDKSPIVIRNAILRIRSVEYSPSSSQ